MKATIALLVALGVAGSAWPQQPTPPPDVDEAKPQLPPGIEIETTEYRIAGDAIELVGPVTIRWRESLIQADNISLRGNTLLAEGNVLLVWEGNRLFGNRMTYDLETETGEILDAMGQLQSEYLFWAKSASKIGPETVHVKSATVTTCTQPVPYWAFKVSSATITVNQYARMWNPRLKASHVPIFYFPYMVWPVKEDRAAGLLFPEFETTQERGFAVTAELFVPLGKSADITFLGRYYTKAGFGGGFETRFLPNPRGAAIFEAFYIDDKVSGAKRWSTSYRQTQEFNNGFRMVADINQLSDFNVYSDFARDLELVSSPSILARIEFSRNGPFTSVNIREARREQLFVDETELVQQTFPEIEFRGRSRKLGKSPLYLSYQASAASIQQQGVQGGVPIDADYLRGDLFPVLSLPLSKLPWLEVTPLLGYRATWWTQRQFAAKGPGGTVSRRVLNDTIMRQIWQVGLDVAGPKIVRVWDRDDVPGKTKFKHLIEPRLTYGFFSEAEDLAQVILYDEVDRFSGSGNSASYALVQRLFAAKPITEVQEPAGGLGITTPAIYPNSPSDAQRFGEYLADEIPPIVTDLNSAPQPVEIANFELRQSISFDRELSFADLDGDGVNEATSRYSSVSISGRYNPSTATSLDLRSAYDILYNEFTGVTVSGSLRNNLSRIRFSFVHSNGLGVRIENINGTRIITDRPDSTQVRLTAGLTFLEGRLKFDVDGSYNFDPPPGQGRVPDRRWRVQYATQCCTITVEQLTREFSSLQDRNDLYLRVDLTGIGKIFSVNY